MTVTCSVPRALMSVARIEAVRPFGEVNVVIRTAPFHCTVEQGNILEPFTDNVKADPLTAASGGKSELIEGTGSDAGGLNVKLTAPEVAAGSEFDTVMLTGPGNAMSA